ncbi:histone deacetylase family protein [Acidihalobacter ferrooxydans]|uniref:Deacetylase n=1 Tax=Acidihalobacter ferrooxydans TaxID=1765967 RepID=A0A1P8UDM4_9GAMM|nr:histone deacetylase family protein [Acidihalobacter ferrooxydans]APZ41952.1 deacetylase [Acidihalobacter ferrooxydans]
MSVLYWSHPSFRLHESAPDHPECGARLDAINDQLIAAGIEPWLMHRVAPAVTREQLERVHDVAYVDEIERVAGGCMTLQHLDRDTVIGPHSLEAARHAAGAVVAAVDAVMTSMPRRAFCAVRPPGHHATRNRAMGFCVYNNVAVGAAHALAVQGLERVAIVDFDVHHGNGTEDVFRHEPRVFMASAFEGSLWSTSDPQEPAPHNACWLDLPAGTRGRAYRARFAADLLPAIDAFAPQLLMISAGFDAHCADDISHLYLVEDDYAWITRELVALAERHCAGRLVSVLEGGYNLPALGRSVVAHLRALLE